MVSQVARECRVCLILAGIEKDKSDEEKSKEAEVEREKEACPSVCVWGFLMPISTSYIGV